MKHVKTIALCAVVALGVGATSATAGTLITGAKIKNGTVAMRDLTPGVQEMIKERPTNGLNGATGATGEKGANGMKGADGTNGLNGKDGLNGTNGADGKNGVDGKDGRDGVRYDRVVDGSGDGGEVSIADGAARLAAPTDTSWAQIRAYPHDLKLRDLKTLSFRSNASDPGVVYMKITTEGHHSVVFSPNTQPGGERGLGTWAAHDVLQGTVRFDDDEGTKADVNWSDVLAQAGDAQVKDVRITAGASGPVGADGALVQVDDLTINDEVIDFN